MEAFEATLAKDFDFLNIICSYNSKYFQSKTEREAKAKQKTGLDVGDWDRVQGQIFIP